MYETETRMTNEDHARVILPPGPALIYVHSDSGNGSVSYTRVDWKPPEVAGGVTGSFPVTFPTERERKILRALLEHALSLLDS